MLELAQPTILRLRLPEDQISLLKSSLTFEDKQVSFLLKRSERAIRAAKNQLAQLDPFDTALTGKLKRKIGFLEKQVKEQKSKQFRCLVFLDRDGYWTYSGLSEYVSALVGADRPSAQYELPDSGLFPYKRMPKFQNRYYQTEAVEALMAAAPHGPAAVDMATGSGKSTVIRSLVKEHSLKTIVMVPSTSIADQLYEDLLHHFGETYVGMFGGGKKKVGKLITVAMDDSLVNILPDSEAWEDLSQAQVFISDEAHLTATATQEKVLSGLAKNAPYRYFVTATLFRNDGKDMLLEGLTGRSVYTKSLRSLVDEGFLAKPKFKVLTITPDVSPTSTDPNEVTRQLLYYSDKVNAKAAEIARYYVQDLKRPTLIRIDEVEQFDRLYRHLKDLRVGFAHGTLTKDNQDLVPKKFHKDVPNDVVRQFNDGELDVLIGTSCIATGTDILVAEAGIYLVGGKSEIEVSQSVGRMTRGGRLGTVFNPWTGVQKVESTWIDFKVEDETLSRHARERISIYNHLYGPVQIIDGDRS